MHARPLTDEDFQVLQVPDGEDEVFQRRVAHRLVHALPHSIQPRGRPAKLRQPVRDGKHLPDTAPPSPARQSVPAFRRGGVLEAQIWIRV